MLAGKHLLVQSNNNTLILDNIDFLNLNYQKKLLLLLENKNFFIKEDILLKQKIIAISSKNIESEVSKGNFIKTLYDRLAVISIKIPSVIYRRDDIILIFEFYINHYNKNKKYCSRS